MSYVCTVEVPKAFCDALNATMTVDLLELPAHAPTNIISRDQSYEVTVSIELGAAIKRLICGEWCISIAAEGIGPAGEPKQTQVVPMSNCDDKPETAVFKLNGSWFGAGGDGCGDVFYLVATVIARDSCEHKPMGIAGFCKIGPVMVYG